MPTKASTTLAHCWQGATHPAALQQPGDLPVMAFATDAWLILKVCNRRNVGTICMNVYYDNIYCEYTLYISTTR